MNARLEVEAWSLNLDVMAGHPCLGARPVSEVCCSCGQVEKLNSFVIGDTWKG